MSEFPRHFWSVPFVRLRATSWRAWAVGLAVLAGVGWAVQGLQDPKMDTSNTVAPLKAQYLFQFAKGNDWPTDVKDGPFLVGVHGNPDLLEELATKYAMQPVGSQALKVVDIAGPTLDEFVHILYTEAEGEALQTLLASTQTKPTLVVTSSPDALPRGAVMNFVSQEGFIKYELDVNNAASRGLLLGNRILSWAVQR
jgi:hypothetical protein